MRIIWGHDDPDLNLATAGWIEAQLHLPRPFRAPYTCGAIFGATRMEAGIILENYVPEHGTIEIGGAAISPKWVCREILAEIGDMVFGKLGCQMAIFRTPDQNFRACRFLEKLGAQCITIPRLRGRLTDENFYYLTDDNWRDQNRWVRHSKNGESHA